MVVVGKWEKGGGGVWSEESGSGVGRRRGVAGAMAVCDGGFQRQGLTSGREYRSRSTPSSPGSRRRWGSLS